MAKSHPSGPTPLGVSIAAVISLGLGIVLGVSTLALQPVPVEKASAQKSATPRKPEKKQGVVVRTPYPALTVYKLGDTSSSFEWSTERSKLNTPGVTLKITESTLNAWSRSRLSNKPPADATFYIAPQQPNFRIADGKLHMVIPLNVSGIEVYSQVSGTFARTADGRQVFVPETFTMGNLIIKDPSSIAEAHAKMLGLYAANKEVTELTKLWPSITNIKIEDNTLILSR